MEIVELVKSKVKNTKFEVSQGAEHSYAFLKNRFPDALKYLIEE